MSAEIFLRHDLPPILLGVLAALSCGLLGNFLVLRRQSLIGDAISHVVLPGIVAAFLITGTTSTWPMMVGAAVAAMIAVGLIDLVRRLGKVEPGAAMGVVFTAMFAAGVVGLEQTDTSSVHLDVEHALYGNLESAVWLDASRWADLITLEKLATLPDQLFRLVVTTLLVIAFVLLLYKELKLVCFDAPFADSIGISSRWIGFALVFMTAEAAVAAFDAVGSILVIAMFICPAATARMLTDRLSTQLWISAGVSVASGVAGYLLAAFAPAWLGTSGSVSAAGMVALVAGSAQGLAILFAPSRGVLAMRWSRQLSREPDAQ